MAVGKPKALIAKHRFNARIRIKTEEGSHVENRWLPDMVECPICHGTGSFVNPRRAKQEDICFFCLGAGRVTTEICDGCGSEPARRRVGSISFCGDPECFKEIAVIAKGRGEHSVQSAWAAQHFQTGRRGYWNGREWVYTDRDSVLKLPDCACD